MAVCHLSLEQKNIRTHSETKAGISANGKKMIGKRFQWHIGKRWAEILANGSVPTITFYATVVFL